MRALASADFTPYMATVAKLAGDRSTGHAHEMQAPKYLRVSQDVQLTGSWNRN